MGRIIYIIWNLILVSVPFILWILPVESVKSGHIELCPSVLLFGKECFGCGITRAVVNFHHWEFQEAIFYNMSVIVVYPFLAYCWVLFLKELLFEIKPSLAKKIPLKTFREFEFLKSLAKKF